MFDPRALKPSKPNVADAPKDSSVKLTMMQYTAPPQEMIRERAYQLYESRGRKPGQEEQDWFRAESELLTHER